MEKMIENQLNQMIKIDNEIQVSVCRFDIFFSDYLFHYFIQRSISTRIHKQMLQALFFVVITITLSFIIILQQAFSMPTAEGM